VLVAIRNFAKVIPGSEINIWWDNQAAVSIFNSGGGKDPVLQAIARNLWLESARLDCNIYFTHIKGADNRTADFLSRW
jgi:inosine-uridine nucleoside N-ribohydrolase